MDEHGNDRIEQVDDEGMSRRRLLGLVGGGLAAGTAGLILPGTTAQAHGTIESYPGIWGQRTVYEGTGNLASFGYRPSFHRRMGSWLEFWANNTPAHFKRPMRVWTYGVHTDSRYSEAHNAGRGFDLTRLVCTGADGAFHRRFYARRDIWKDWPLERRRRARRHYWATAASLHHHFRNVLTYLYDANHQNHIHIDNLVSGLDNSEFSTGSRAQVQHVQACCRYVWGMTITIDGQWGDETRTKSTRVLRRIGQDTGTIATSKANWLAFNRATCRKGYGVQEY